MYKINPKLNKKLIINIMVDTILFYRTAEGVNSILDSFGFNEEDCDRDNFGAIAKYKGLDNAFMMLGIDVDSKDTFLLRDDLQELFNKELFSTKRADEIAETTFKQWTEYLSAL